ncbi:MAG: 23S rRNA (adenine(2503)-C(2))-methyltransferase RlmN [Coprothermobacterota bacterium]|nr:23S rRNA (adenine(2503)-C(2))-methyltransferase RlmN [Coprothermobacterota bacterium]
MIFQLSYEELAAYLASRGEAAYRSEQVWGWLYRQSVSSFEEMITLSLPLRRHLEADHPGSFPELIDRAISRDGSEKVLWALADGELVESVLLQTETREGSWTSACLSTQVGCPMGCSFCATGQAGFRRNLTAGEILAQLVGLRAKSGERVGRLLLMGMGEPLLNVDAVKKAIRLAQDPRGLSLGGRRITLSTVAPRNLAQFLASGPHVEMALSLHAPNDLLRASLIEHANSLLPIRTALELLYDYRREAGRMVTVEYLMLAEINDTWSHAKELASLLEGSAFFVNLLPFNTSPGLPYRSSPAERIRAFAEVLRASGLTVKIRKPRGADIGGACGQLRGQRSLS